MYEWQRAVNMSSKWCCVLAVVCVSVMLLSLDADAQPPVDNDSSQCGSALLQQVANMVSVIASNQQEMKDKMQEIVVEVRKLKAFSALMLLVGRQEGHPACKKTEWWGAGMVISLERGADLHTAQLMPLPLTVSCFSKILGLALYCTVIFCYPARKPQEC